MQIFLLSLLSILILSPNSLCQEINEIIQTVNLTSGEKKTFLINDLFYLDKEYRITFDPDTSVEVFYEAENSMVDITSLKNSEGYGVLPFYFYDKKYHIIKKFI